MQFTSSLVAAFLCLPVALSAVVTQVDYVTRYEYQDVNVYVDNNGVPYSTETQIVSTQAVIPASTSEAPAPKPTTASSSTEVHTEGTGQLSHSHAEPANYQYITPSESSAPAPAPVTTSAEQTTSAYVPAPTPVKTTSSEAPSPAPSSTSNGGDNGGSGDISGEATYYDVGLGACGVTNSDDELIAALNVDQFNSFGAMSNGNPVCGKKATLHYQGKSVTVTIQDKCPGCKHGDLDLSPAAFKHLADLGAGRIPITWSFE